MKDILTKLQNMSDHGADTEQRGKTFNFFHDIIQMNLIEHARGPLTWLVTRMTISDFNMCWPMGQLLPIGGGPP